MEQKVEILEKIPETKLVGRKFGPFNEGEETYVKPWEVPILEERQLAEPIEDFSSTGLRKLLIREEKSSQLKDIPPYFYISVSQKIRILCQKGEDEEVEKIREIIDSLISLRIRKLAEITISSGEVENLPPEEILLANRISQAMKIWKKRLNYLFKTPSKEVGAHEERTRRCIQRIVKNSTDIQK